MNTDKDMAGQTNLTAENAEIPVMGKFVWGDGPLDPPKKGPFGWIRCKSFAGQKRRKGPTRTGQKTRR